MIAVAQGKDLPISPKDSMMICNAIRGKEVKKAEALLVRVSEEKEAIPFTKFTDGVGHRKGTGAAGRYPLIAVRAFQKVLKSAIANAQVKGMNTSKLSIIEAKADRAARSYHYGRKRGIQTKATHLKISLGENK